MSSNISVKKHGSELPAEASSLTPLRMMRRLLGWDPFQQMTPFFPADEPALSFAPAFEVKETTSAYDFRGDIPGVDEDDIDVTVTANRLTISGARAAETDASAGQYFATERLYGSFVRTFTLPDGVDPEGVSASLVSGVLHVTVPKKLTSQPKKIALTKSEPAGKLEPEETAEARTEGPIPVNDDPVVAPKASQTGDVEGEATPQPR